MQNGSKTIMSIPTQTGSVICCPLEAVDIECRPPRADKPSKRAKKLRAVSGACPRRSPNWQHSRGRELLPVRRTLFQIDVLGFRKNVRALCYDGHCGQGEPSNDKDEHVASCNVWSRLGLTSQPTRWPSSSGVTTLVG